MKIFSINNIYNSVRNQSFKGLWGKSSTNTDFNPLLCLPTNRKTYYYYPCIGESPERVRNIKESIDKAGIERENDKDQEYNIEECKICATLPFTTKEYLEYSKFKPTSKLTKKIYEIHSAVRDKYKNKDLDSEQISAQNPNVEQKVQEEPDIRRLLNNPDDYE